MKLLDAKIRYKIFYNRGGLQLSCREWPSIYNKVMTRTHLSLSAVDHRRYKMGNILIIVGTGVQCSTGYTFVSF